MDVSGLYKKLITAARATPPDGRVPLAFEQRIMAQLAGRTPQDAWVLWGQALTRAAIFCLALMLVMAAGSKLVSTENPNPLSQEVEQTLIAAADGGTDQAGEVW
jgi:hypothetical protein